MWAAKNRLIIVLRLIPTLVLFICFLGNFSSAQNCQRTVAQPSFNHSCPFRFSEAYTIETRSSSGRSLFQKECCDAKGVFWNQAAVKGCIATHCVPYNNNQPCTSLPRYIVNNQYVPYEDIRRDHCTGQQGQVAVCCPPNSQANLLVSAYGAEQNEFPHQVRLETEDEVCGGTIFNYNTIITAAHCVVDNYGNFKNPKTMKLILGTNIATPGGNHGWVYPVDRIIVHPGFSLHQNNPEFQRVFISRRTYNDVALVRLARNINFSKNIQALPIAPANFDPGHYGSHVTIVGWGTTDNGITSQYLQKANLLVRRDEQCFKSAFGGLPYPNTQELGKQLHCFGGILNGLYSAVAGKGDSGGPAICRGPDGYAVLCGVTSFGADGDYCRRQLDETSCLPSVYADVSYFRNWILSNAGGQDGSTLLRKVVFGDYKQWGNYPHQVKITSKGGPYCGGTLISKDTVVTAGHCVFDDGKSVRNGLKIITKDGRQYAPRQHQGVMAPNGYASYGTLIGLRSTSFQGPTWIDNLAMIRLNGEVPINYASLPTVPRPWTAASENQYILELAWPQGKTRNNEYLVQRRFKVLAGNECQKRLERLRILGVQTNFREMGKFICGVEDYSGGGVCERLLGGGVICPGNGGAGILCGVQTFRFCDMSMPTVFANIGAYSDVIGRYMG